MISAQSHVRFGDFSSLFAPMSNSCSSCGWFLSSAHLSPQQSRRIKLLSPHYSRNFHFYQEEGEQGLGFKKKMKKNILESHPSNTQDKDQIKEQVPRKYRREDGASALHFISQFNTANSNTSSSPGKLSGNEEEDGHNLIMTITHEKEEEGLHTESPKKEEEEYDDDTGGPVVCRRRQIVKRSTMIAKQVISIHLALSLGFISQLWVDTNVWVVSIVEVKPNLLSGELERFFLVDIAKVGDVVLVEDESVMDNNFKLVGLETLVGYSVVTPSRKNIGKVRGYSFDINSGMVESLELDSFGISIIPSSLVSTYALLVEDVLEVLPDTVVVHEAAASRMQRLTKGFWNAAQNKDGFVDEFEEEDADYRASWKRNFSSGEKFPTEVVEPADEWELPMDYL